MPGGSQLPFTQVQPVPGCGVVQLAVPPELVLGGSQLPFTQIQSGPG